MTTDTDLRQLNNLTLLKVSKFTTVCNTRVHELHHQEKRQEKVLILSNNSILK